MVELESLDNVDQKDLQGLIENHFKYTESSKAKELLDNWEVNVKHFIKVIPTDYKKALERLALEQQLVTA